MAKVCIIGGGHNGLVAANILAQKHHEVILLEAKNLTGGAASNEILENEVFNWGANHLFLLREEVIHQTGFEFDKLSIKSAKKEFYFIGDKADSWMQSLNTLPEFLLFSKELQLASDLFWHSLYAEGSSVEFLEKLEALSLSSGLAFAIGSLADVLFHYFGDNTDAQKIILSGKVLSLYSPFEEGSAVSFLYLAGANEERFGAWSSAKAGMGAVVEEFEQMAKNLGVKVLTESTVTEFKIQNNVISSALLCKGDEITADWFLSAVSPPSLARILSTSGENNGFSNNKFAEWTSATQDGGCSKLLIETSSPLEFNNSSTYALKDGMLAKPMTLQEFEVAYQDAVQNGHSRTPYFEIFCHSLFHDINPSKYLYSVYLMYSSYERLEKMGQSDRKLAADQLIEYVLSHVCNRQVVTNTELMDPLGIEKHFNLPRGNVDHGRFTWGHVLDRRCTLNSAELPLNLTLGGAGILAGGLVSGLPGLLSAKKVLSEIRRMK